jgi:hypothetical protein
MVISLLLVTEAGEYGLFTTTVTLYKAGETGKADE